MSTELTNLLPAKRQRALRRQYFLRLTTVALLVLAVLIVIHGLLLLPTYLYSVDRAARARAQLGAVETLVQSPEEEMAKARSETLAQTVELLSQADTRLVTSGALRAVLAVPRTGISLTGFTVTAPGATGTARMQVSGIASSRDDLRQYTSALGSLPFVTTADLPISAYARESAIPFTITLNGTLLP